VLDRITRENYISKENILMEGDISMPIATVTSKWQVTIPSQIRKAMGLKPHDRIVFRKPRDGVLIQLVRDFLSFYGAGEHRGAPLDFDRLRDRTASEIGRHVQGEMG